MRIIIATLVVAGAAVSGCASMGPREQPLSYRQELAQLRTTCENRGGILTPLGSGSTGGRPANDYACEIRGGGSGRLGQ
jgi:hypothetical protein